MCSFKNSKIEKTNSNIWVIRAGVGGKAHDLFIQKKTVGLEDPRLGDLRNLEGTRSAFYTKYRESHPAETKTGSSGIAGKFYRLMYEVKENDIIIYPSIIDDIIYIGKITGQYKYSTDLTEKYPHQRIVKWLIKVPKDQIPEQVKREMGAARTFFKISRNEIYFISKINNGI